jgi:hypothetical protein
MSEHTSEQQLGSPQMDEQRELGAPLFPPRKVPSYIEVVGPKAAEDYRRIRADLDAQELDNQRRERAARRLGSAGLEQ